MEAQDDRREGLPLAMRHLMYMTKALGETTSAAGRSRTVYTARTARITRAEDEPSRFRPYRRCPLTESVRPSAAFRYYKHSRCQGILRLRCAALRMTGALACPSYFTASGITLVSRFPSVSCSITATFTPKDASIFSSFTTSFALPKAGTSRPIISAKSALFTACSG